MSWRAVSAHPATSRKLRGHILEGDSVMGSLSIWHWLIVLAIVILVFGTKKLRNAGGDLGSAVKNFKQSMKDGEEDAPKTPAQLAQEQQKRDSEAREHEHEQTRN